MAKGEELILEVYNVLRNSPQWDKTLLIITYDEHGGCFDHIAPPENATAPDNTIGQFGFDFTRFGPRVPAVLISPYIEAGTVFRVPQGSVPLDHTSILKTIEQRFNLPALTKRDAAAPGFGDVLTLSKPRSDNPLEGVKAPVSNDKISFDDEPDHLQKLYVDSMNNLPNEETLNKPSGHKQDSFATSDEAMDYGHKRYQAYFAEDKEQNS